MRLGLDSRRRTRAGLILALTARHAALAVAGDSQLLDLDENSFDVLLRQTPVALVVYENPTTSMHYPRLRPALEALADAYAHAGIGVGCVSSRHTELVERFGVFAFPTLHWMDGSRKWPHYASEATPEPYDGPRGFEALAAFVEAKTGMH